jgi:ubiquinone/menaquinone biosynthesis C-methylase UbiE
MSVNEDTNTQSKATAQSLTSDYAFGNTDAEHERLIRQATGLAPCTERFFLEAGILAGQRVLDIGSGVGDVSMLASRLVGPSGEVVGVERDSRSISRARKRVADAGLRNVSFIESDVALIPEGKPFDAVVGRLILQFLPDPPSVLRSLSRLVHPGGLVAFQEVAWAPVLPIFAHLPLWSAAASLVLATVQRAGADTGTGLALFRIFHEAGLPAPTMRMEAQLGNDPRFTRWICDLLCSLRPRIHQGQLLEKLGDWDSLPSRMQVEVAKSNSVVPFVPLVSAWSRKPTDESASSCSEH